MDSLCARPRKQGDAVAPILQMCKAAGSSPAVSTLFSAFPNVGLAQNFNVIWLFIFNFSTNPFDGWPFASGGAFPLTFTLGRI
jgi:hypothetical protein